MSHRRPHPMPGLTDSRISGIVEGQVVEACDRFWERRVSVRGSPMNDPEWNALVQRLLALDPLDFEAAVAAVRLSRTLSKK